MLISPIIAAATMDRRTEWIVLVSLLLFQHVIGPAESAAGTLPQTTDNVTSPGPKNQSTAREVPRRGLAKVGAIIATVFKALVVWVEFMANAMYHGSEWIVVGVKTVWKQLMTAGVFVFQSQYKALIVIYRLNDGD